jgi:anti-anti-sigma factor
MAALHAPAAFRVRADHEPGQTVLWLAGELDVVTAGDLVREIARHIARDRPIVLDLGSLTFMDGSGVRAIQDGTTDAVIGGSSVRVRNVPQIMVRHFGALGVFGPLHSLA